MPNKQKELIWGIRQTPSGAWIPGPIKGKLGFSTDKEGLGLQKAMAYVRENKLRENILIFGWKFLTK